MNREQALQHVRAHERAAAAATRPAKRQQHLESVRYLREKYDIPEAVIVKAIPPEIAPREIFGRDHEAINRAAEVQREQQRKEQEFKNR